ncbi:MAG: nuclear transport factor 2 family protein [Alphaproteobacteria bacterium]|jgi:predicted SnoaL-like aldol condensation-catalyzing enzyme|nr:SnoaL-like domain-containing protein [Rhodospirillaceae bacterium]MDG2479521.1 nuclear transport factor 2 family protein [Alphaproteobacteria bacterium]
MTIDRRDQVRALLKAIETGDPEAVAVVSTETYIQHNPQTLDGSEGLAELCKRLSLKSPKVAIVRTFEDGDFVFGHTEYDFGNPRVGFEVFRFEDGLIVEHWDNIQPRQGPNSSGRPMTDGPTEAVDLEKTEANRALVRYFVAEVLIGRDPDRLASYIDRENFSQHNPDLADGSAALQAFLETGTTRYERNHRVLAQGSFVLAGSEGTRDGVHTAFYDLFRVEGGRLVEHWDAIEAIAPREEWKNDNGKF